jgi:hypothetical protein
MHFEKCAYNTDVGVPTSTLPPDPRHAYVVPMVQEPRTTAFEDERHARLRPLSRSVGTADEVPGHGSVSVACQLHCQSRCGLARVSAQAAHCPVSATSQPDHGE